MEYPRGRSALGRSVAIFSVISGKRGGLVEFNNSLQWYDFLPNLSAKWLSIEFYSIVLDRYLSISCYPCSYFHEITFIFFRWCGSEWKQLRMEAVWGAGWGRVWGCASLRILVLFTNENVMKGITRALLGLWWLCIRTQQLLYTSPSDTNFYPGTLFITPYEFNKA